VYKVIRKILFFLFLLLFVDYTLVNIPLWISRSFEANIYIYNSKHVYSDSVCLHRRLHFLQVAPITSAIYFSQAISALRAISARSNELRDWWAMHPVFADRKRSSEIRSSRILGPLPPCSPSSPLPSFIFRSSFLSFSFLVSRAPKITVTYLVPSFSQQIAIDRDRGRVRTLRWNCTIRLTLLRCVPRSRSVLLLLVDRLVWSLDASSWPDFHREIALTFR